MAATPLREIVDYPLLFDCVHCGLCLEACPTYIVTRAEMDSPRGRIYLMKAIAEGRADLDDDAVRHLDLCLGCRGCETACPSGVHYGRLIEQARGYVERNAHRTMTDRLRRWAVSALFPYPNRLRVLLAPLVIIERLGLRPALTRLMPAAMREWIELLPPLTGREPAESTPVIASADRNAPSVLVHRGCIAQVLGDSANRSSASLLQRAGYTLAAAPPSVCCGALDLHGGNTARALEFARANVRAIKISGADTVLSAASGCSAAMAEYGELLKDDRELAAAAREVSGKVSDLSSLLAARPVEPREFNRTVTYHDACHLAHGLGVRQPPRDILARIPGVRLVELGESDLCCGSAGSYNLTEPAMARELARRKVDNIIATGADYVVMANPGCQLQIAAELRRRGVKTRAIHLADFLILAARSG